MIRRKPVRKRGLFDRKKLRSIVSFTSTLQATIGSSTGGTGGRGWVGGGGAGGRGDGGRGGPNPDGKRKANTNLFEATRVASNLTPKGSQKAANR
jgi:hypothetical protein